ncbi:MAG TPA: acyl-CoA synthetase FdrA [Candidatus Limnocylindrales bacterium]|jgi:succinyl-CoA synthetase alpha subunit|nr:acyl-CoA synthetase FdrA [Candidatus Limnocylindrales bacterium]
MTETIRGAVYRNSYRDSVELMGIAAELERLPGIVRAGLVMATPANLAVLAGAGMGEAAADGAGPNDLVVAVAAADEDAATTALGRAGALLAAGAGGDAGASADKPAAQTIGEGVAELPDANLALVSTPGTYATAEAIKALKHGLHVFLFSDNVSVEDEIELKTLAGRKGLLVMGPDCGTAIVGGVPLGFANAVRRGPIGLAAASGTGLQQVSSLIDRFGSGVSHAIGTGGRDLDERVGGRTMLAAIELLLADPGTTVLVLISKPPSESVVRAILDAVRGASRPVVVNFLGGDPDIVRAAGAHPAATFEEAALIATALAAGGDPNPGPLSLDPALAATAEGAAARLAPGQSAVRGLFSGGSLAGEAKIILESLRGPAAHDVVLDLGDDEYTVGRPHPMIDPRLRNEQIVAAAGDPDVAVILLDVVLGYGSNPDPAAALAPAIREAQEVAAAAGRSIAFVASVCGTATDPQGLDRQEAALAGAGVILAPSNARAAMVAARIAEHGVAAQSLVAGASGALEP